MAGYQLRVELCLERTTMLWNWGRWDRTSRDYLWRERYVIWRFIGSLFRKFSLGGVADVLILPHWWYVGGIYLVLWSLKGCFNLEVCRFIFDMLDDGWIVQTIIFRQKTFQDLVDLFLVCLDYTLKFFTCSKVLLTQSRVCSLFQSGGILFHSGWRSFDRSFRIRWKILSHICQNLTGFGVLYISWFLCAWGQIDNLNGTCKLYTWPC